MKVYMKSKHDGGYEAYGIYDDGKLIVKKGSRIRLKYAENFKRTHAAVDFRNDPTCVDKNGILLKDCMFMSPSTAAQFVNGRSTNGYIAWHVDKRTNLKEWLQEKSMMEV